MAKKTAPASTLTDIEGRAFEVIPTGDSMSLVPDDSQSAASADAGEAPAPKRGRGRPRGSGKSAKSPSAREWQRRAEAAEAQVAATETEDERRRALAQSLAMTCTVAASLYAGAAPERQPWRLSESEAQQLGDVWAPVLLPYMAAIGTAMPWGVALMATLSIWSTKRDAVAQLTPETTVMEGDPRD